MRIGPKTKQFRIAGLPAESLDIGLTFIQVRIESLIWPHPRATIDPFSFPSSTARPSSDTCAISKHARNPTYAGTSAISTSCETNALPARRYRRRGHGLALLCFALRLNQVSNPKNRLSTYAPVSRRKGRREGEGGSAQGIMTPPARPSDVRSVTLVGRGIRRFRGQRTGKAKMVR